jgi:hypothetical protein
MALNARFHLQFLGDTDDMLMDGLYFRAYRYQIVIILSSISLPKVYIYAK